jgi:hypothetical protein
MTHMVGTESGPAEIPTAGKAPPEVRRLFSIAGVGVLLLVVGLFFGAMPSGSLAKEPLLPPPIYSVPSFAVLGHGRTGGYRWDTLLYRHSGRPCLDTTVSTNGLAHCARPGPLSLAVIGAGSRRHRVTVTAVLAKPYVRAVEIELDRAGRTASPEVARVQPIGWRRASLGRVDGGLRFAIRVLLGPVCVVRLRAFGRLGQTLFQSPRYKCGY